MGIFKGKGLMILLSTLATAGCAGASADSSSCSRLESAWRSKYLEDFDIAWDTEKFDCPGGESVLAMALHDLDQTVYQPNDYGFSPDFYGILKRNIRHFRYEKECKYLAKTSGDRVTICPAYLTNVREDRASTLIHEARHAEDSDSGHVTCSGGPHEGDVSACDGKFFDGGWQGSGFNADVFYLNWTLKAGKNNELSKDVLQSKINSFVPDRFNEIKGEEIRKWRR